MSTDRSIGVVFAPDSFKGSLTSLEVARALATGWSRGRPDDRVLLAPLADGGEGTLVAIEAAGGWEWREAQVADPLGRSIRGRWLRSTDGQRAVVEMAEASGLTLIIEAGKIPLLPSARELARKKLLSGGAARNREFLGDRVSVDAAVPPELAWLLFDSETSGGLLISIPEDAARSLIEELHAKGHPETALIGRIAPRGPRWVVVS